MLAGVIAAGTRRVATVVGADDQQRLWAHQRQQFRQPAVEGLQRGGVSGQVPTVPVEHVEVDEVGEHQAVVWRLPAGLERGIEQRIVTVRLVQTADAAVGENIADLANGMHGAAGFAQAIQQRGRRCSHGGCRCGETHPHAPL